MSELSHYLEMLSRLERLHRLRLDLVKDEFERLGEHEINAVQALLLFNLGDNEVTASELKSRGYYQGSNVSYNLRKLTEMGYLDHRKSEVDLRSVRVKLTPKGKEIRDILLRLFTSNAEGLETGGVFTEETVEALNTALARLERYWSDRIRYIY